MNEAKKLYENIKKYSDKETAESIAFGMDLPTVPTNDEKKEWVNYITNELEKNFSENVIKKIRMGCYCYENGKLEDSRTFVKMVYEKSKDLENFVDNMNAYGAGWFLKNGFLYTKYFSCSCPMLEGVDFLPTKTWCYCTVGFNKKIFEDVFNCEVDIDLIESIKMGDKQCLMKIIPRN